MRDFNFKNIHRIFRIDKTTDVEGYIHQDRK